MTHDQTLDEHTFEQLRKKEFGRLGNQVYLDHAGSCLYANSHIQKYHQHLAGNVFGNPHSGNACSERTSDIIYQTRLEVLRRFNVSFDDYDVIFTSGATASLKIVGEYFSWTSGSTFAYAEDNHTSVVGIRELASDKGANSYCFSCVRTKSLSKFKLVKPAKRKCDDDQLNDGAIPVSLFAFPAQSNFSGAKYPLTWISQVKRGAILSELREQTSINCKWYVLCDAASFVSTSMFDLKEHDADFVTMSFYKLFGFPTGLGALLVKKSSADTLCNKHYFGGGSVSGWLPSRDFHSPKPSLHDRFEDGTTSFLSILALKLGFDTFASLGLNIDFIERHTHRVWAKLHSSMKALHHENGNPLVEIYINGSDIDISSQGPILAFNIRRSDGSYIGYNHVLQLANSNDIYLRGGCFCNIGACISLIDVHSNVLLSAFQDGHVCGDAIDLIDGKPIGALRISLGPYSSEMDVDVFVNFLSSCFVEEMNSNLVYAYPESEKPTNIVLDEIVLYPIKSCQGMQVTEWQICETGLKYDRMWMVIDEYGSPVTLKKSPHLISIYPQVDISKKSLTLKAEGMENIDVPFIMESELRTQCLNLNPKCVSKVCGDSVIGFDCGESVALWLSQILGVACSLVQKSFESLRYTKKRLNRHGSQNEITLVNEAQLLLINRSSIEYLYTKMVKSGYVDDADSDVMLHNIAKRFRANLIVSGAPAFSEDLWRTILITSTSNNSTPGIPMTKCGLCNRCNVICIDPDTGQKLNGPLTALANVCLGGNTVRRKPTFGIYLKCDGASIPLRVQSQILIQTSSPAL